MDIAARERPISFTPALLQAIVEGRKTQTRRPVRPIPERVSDGVAYQAEAKAIVPKYNAGDRLWVQEKWARTHGGFVYERGGAAEARWKSSRFMPRAAARVFLSVASVRLERLQAIEEVSATAEGCEGPEARLAFLTLWDSIYGEGEFAAGNDPWVWAIAFRVAQ